MKCKRMVSSYFCRTRFRKIPVTLTRHSRDRGLTECGERVRASGGERPLTDFRQRGRIAPPRREPMDRHAPEPSAQITLLLRKWQGGDRAALDRLIPLVYSELHVIASRYMAHEWRAGTLQTTALVNEAYLKLVDQRK